MKYLKINNLKNLENYSKEIASKLNPGDIILLNGEMGVGKTTFSQFLGKQLGVKEKIQSPTFNIVKEYKLEKPFEYFVHIDAYRLNNKSIDDIQMIEEYMTDKNILCIEWSKNILNEKKLDKYIKIDITKTGENERDIKETRK